MTENIFGKNVFDVYFDFLVPPANMEGVEFTTYTGTSHQGATEMFVIFIYSLWFLHFSFCTN